MAINISNYKTLPEQVEENKENITNLLTDVANIQGSLVNYVPFEARETDIQLNYQSLDISADNGFTLETNSEDIKLDAKVSGKIDLYGSALWFNGINMSTYISNLAQAVENLGNNKQDTLTAGDNITIENNVISASGGGMTEAIVEYQTIPQADEDSATFIYVNGVLYAKTEVE